MRNFLLILFFVSPLTTTPQNLSQKVITAQLLEVAHQYKNSGDFLVASLLFRQIARQASDSTQIAEALYNRLTCGNIVARLLATRMQTTIPPKDDQGIGLTQQEFQEIIQREIADYKQAGITLQIRHTYDDYVVNVDTLTLYLLAQHFPKTPFGERARFDLITLDTTAIETGTPGGVIDKAEAFLREYPKSNFRYDVYLHIAEAYEDLWNLVHNEEEYPPSGVQPLHRTPEQELKTPTAERLKAVQYLELVRKNKTKLILSKWSPDLDRELSTLRRGEFTNTFRFADID
jgi:hypothetical protein